jgi:chorismate mutase
MSDAPPRPETLAAIRAEIDALDDALHDLLMRRAAVVARLAGSRAKGQGAALRPGREAAILRRLFARHEGPLPRVALLRIWRELLAATTAMQAPLPTLAALDPARVMVLRAHLGLGAGIAMAGSAEAALAGLAAGQAALAALPWPDADWPTLPPGLHVTARLPLAGPGPAVALVSATPPDPSGADATLWLPPGAHRPETLSGFRLDDPALAADGGRVLGAYALPLDA